MEDMDGHILTEDWQKLMNYLEYVYCIHYFHKSSKYINISQAAKVFTYKIARIFRILPTVLMILQPSLLFTIKCPPLFSSMVCSPVCNRACNP